MRICAVIPAYNEVNHIADVIKRTTPHVEKVLVVDDGSTDNTGDVARECGAEVLVHNPNTGKGKSLRDGLDWAAEHGFDAAIALDADGQHLPEEISRFSEVLPEADLIVGNRMSEVEDMPFVRLKTNQFTSWVVSKLAGVRVPDSQCGFRMIRTDIWTQLEIESSRFDFESEMLVSAGRKGFRVTSVPVSTIYGDEVSKINPFVDTVRFFRMVWRLWWKR